MSTYEECVCGRGSYDPDQYTSCFECFQDRHDGMLECVWCGRWHSQKYGTCFRCRATPDRDNAGIELRRMVLSRGRFRCRYCGSDENLQVDHIMPCAVGGTADPWNLQTLCVKCNRDKGREWSDYGKHGKARRESVEVYYVQLWEYLTEVEQYWLNIEVIEWLGYAPRGEIDLVNS